VTDDVAVVVAVTTRNRVALLEECLRSVVGRAELAPRSFLREVLVVDGDPARSAEAVVARVQRATRTPLRYIAQATPGLARARSDALAAAPAGSVLVFIDDDEQVETQWPAGLLGTMRQTGAHLVAGPVLRRVPPDAPAVLAAVLLRRPEHQHGQAMIAASTDNLAIDVDAVRAAAVDFDARYDHSGGEDSAFTTAAVQAGLRLHWSEVGLVSEHVPAERLTEPWLLTRARHGAATWLLARARTRRRPVQAAVVAASAAGWATRGTIRRMVGVAARRELLALDGRLDHARVRGALDALRGATVETYGRAQQ
jgi:succinoglycan biosynthesis protein ExoM